MISCVLCKCPMIHAAAQRDAQRTNTFRVAEITLILVLRDCLSRVGYVSVLSTPRSVCPVSLLLLCCGGVAVIGRMHPWVCPRREGRASYRTHGHRRAESTSISIDVSISLAIYITSSIVDAGGAWRALIGPREACTPVSCTHDYPV